MNSYGRSTVGLCLLALSGVLLEGQPALTQGPPDPQLDRVFSDWKKRQERTKSVRYRVVGESVCPKGSFCDPEGRLRPGVPPRDVIGTIKRALLLDFATSRYRYEVEEEQYDEGTDRLYPFVSTRIFDGATIKQWRPRERNTHPVSGLRPSDPEIGIGKGHFGPLDIGFWPFFVGHGIVGWLRGVSSPGKLQVQPDMDMLYRYRTGIHRGRQCLVLRSYPLQGVAKSYDEFWVDSARESAIVRQVVYRDKVAQYDYDIEYQETAHGWLPQGWTFTWRDVNSGTTTDLDRVRVVGLDLDPTVSDADFQLEEKPGMLVDERTYPEPRTRQPAAPKPQDTLYRIGESGQRHQVVIEDGVERRVRPWWPWWWAVGLVPVAGLSAWLICRWRTAFFRVRAKSSAVKPGPPPVLDGNKASGR